MRVCYLPGDTRQRPYVSPNQPLEKRTEQNETAALDSTRL